MQKENIENEKPIKTSELSSTLLDEGKFLRIVTELPGINEEKIKIYLENHSTSVNIVASDSGNEFTKKITIPCEVRFCKKRFSDGILELTLEKTDNNTVSSFIE
jgi:HSP20 family molecular chaperone IbpA